MTNRFPGSLTTYMAPERRVGRATRRRGRRRGREGCAYRIEEGSLHERNASYLVALDAKTRQMSDGVSLHEEREKGHCVVRLLWSKSSPVGFESSLCRAMSRTQNVRDCVGKE
jgi:hypothetical protein